MRTAEGAAVLPALPRRRKMKTYRTASILAGALVSSVSLVSAARADEAPRGALSCSGCHAAKQATVTAIPRLHGRPSQATIAALQGFKSGRLPATVMDRIARGFTDEEISAVAHWFAAQK